MLFKQSNAPRVKYTIMFQTRVVCNQNEGGDCIALLMCLHLVGHLIISVRHQCSSSSGTPCVCLQHAFTHVYAHCTIVYAGCGCKLIINRRYLDAERQYAEQLLLHHTRTCASVNGRVGIVICIRACVCSQLNGADAEFNEYLRVRCVVARHRFRAAARKSRWLFVTHHLITACWFVGEGFWYTIFIRECRGQWHGKIWFHRMHGLLR